MRRWIVCLSLILAALFGVPARAATDAEPLNMGFYLPGIRDANLADVKISLQLWAEEVGSPFGLLVKAHMYDDMHTLHRDVVQGRINIIIAPGMEMAEIFSPEEITRGFAGRRRNTEEGLALIVAKASGVRQFSDLRGKRLARLSNDRLVDVYLETQCQQQAGVACSNLFTISEEKRDVQSIHKVFFGQVDAALVRLSALHAASEMNPQIEARLRVLLDWKTTALSFGMMTVHSEPAYRDLVLRSAMQATKTVRGKQILELFKTDYMEQVSKNDLQPYWRLQREYQELTKSKATRKP